MFDSFLQRLFVVILLPNILVIEFWASDMNNNHNFLWYTLIGPYWHLEKYIVIAALTVAGGVLAWMGFQRIPNLIDIYIEIRNDWQSSQEEFRFQREQERQRAELKAQDEAAKKAYLALPLAERQRIEKARVKQADAERQRWVRAKEELELRQKAEAENIRREKELELERKRTLENSPEYQREKVLREFTGGRR